ncbi:hypothetical protein C8Q74DRAFT_1365774 [Fomes fomentarius]|nr:hypothetical protein C8Q74DRAFT_1365774 [Fomes fomentarius]
MPDTPTSIIAGSNPRSRTAPAPFNKSNADIILRTSDLIDFHVFSQVLTAASSFFEGMFEMPQPPSEQQELKLGRPIIPVSEDSVVIETLLRICYPIVYKPRERTLEEIESALRAAMKYEMELPTTVLLADLKKVLSTQPTRVWAIACRLGLEDVAREVAMRYCPTRMRYYLVPMFHGPSMFYGLAPSDLWTPPDFDILGEMEGITAGDVYRMHEFCRLKGRVSPQFQFLTPLASTTIPHSGANKQEEPPDIIADVQQRLDTLPHHDLVVCSSDDVRFPVHRAVFRTSPSSISEAIEIQGAASSNSLPVLRFAETGVIVAALLRFCYQVIFQSSFKPTLPQLARLLAAAERHELAFIHSLLKRLWSVAAKEEPLRAYCLAMQAGHAACAKEAAQHALDKPLDGVYVPEFEHTSGLAYHRLRTLSDCAAKRKAVVEPAWIWPNGRRS